MSRPFTKINFSTSGGGCVACDDDLEGQIESLPGVREMAYDFLSNRGTVTFDPKKTSLDIIFNRIEHAGYARPTCRPSSWARGLSIMARLAVFGLGASLFLAFLWFSDKLWHPEITATASYGLLFLIGLLTGSHCIGMCGGLVLAYSLPQEDPRSRAQAAPNSWRRHLAYGLGKTLSYIVLGALFGLLGSFIAITPTIRGWTALAAGVYLVLFALHMFRLIPMMKRWLLRTPRAFDQRVRRWSGHLTSPLFIGLLNGLMLACGPLQAIYILAAGKGSPIEGALMLASFGLGTLPLLLGFGILTGSVNRIGLRGIQKVSSVMVLLLGLITLNRGLILTGSGHDAQSILARLERNLNNPGPGLVEDQDQQTIYMTVTAEGWSPAYFELTQGIPVRWVIDAQEITSCNRRIQVPQLNLEFDLVPGRQLIEFIPPRAGIVPWSCWMGMIDGRFEVSARADARRAAKPEPRGSQ